MNPDLQNVLRHIDNLRYDLTEETKENSKKMDETMDKLEEVFEEIMKTFSSLEDSIDLNKTLLENILNAQLQRINKKDSD